jgi:hypothetical protein
MEWAGAATEESLPTAAPMAPPDGVPRCWRAQQRRGVGAPAPAPAAPRPRPRRAQARAPPPPRAAPAPGPCPHFACPAPPDPRPHAAALQRQPSCRCGQGGGGMGSERKCQVVPRRGRRAGCIVHPNRWGRRRRRRAAIRGAARGARPAVQWFVVSRGPAASFRGRPPAARGMGCRGGHVPEMRSTRGPRHAGGRERNQCAWRNAFHRGGGGGSFAAEGKCLWGRCTGWPEAAPNACACAW